MKLNLDNWTVKLLCLFLATDITFIIFYLLYAYTGLTSNYLFSLAQDRGYSEIFQYVKEYWIVLLLGFIAVRTRSFLFLNWSLLFFYLLLDDAARIHERFGNIISKKLAFPAMFNLRPQDFGELTVSILVGGLFLSLIGIAYYFGDQFSRKATRCLLLLLLALSFFGIAVDMLDIAFNIGVLAPLLVALEDGGELVIMSVIAYFVFVLSERFQSLQTRKQ